MTKMLEKAVTSLQQGLVIAYPTEAVYGLGCDPTNQQAVLSLLVLKQRPVEKGLILVAGQFDTLSPFVDISKVPSDTWRQIQQSWPGPVTWVLPKSETCPAWISGQFGSVAVRVSAHPIVQQLTDSFGLPLVSTSANLAGADPALSAEDVFEMFGDRLGYVIDHPLGKESAPSKIFDALTGKQIR